MEAAVKNSSIHAVFKPAIIGKNVELMDHRVAAGLFLNIKKINILPHSYINNAPFFLF